MNTKDFMLLRNSGNSPVKLLFDKSLNFSRLNFIKNQIQPIYSQEYSNEQVYKISSCVRFWIPAAMVPVRPLEDKFLVIVQKHIEKCK